MLDSYKLLMTMLSMGRGKAKGRVGMLMGKGIEIRIPGLPIEYAE